MRTMFCLLLILISQQVFAQPHIKVVGLFKDKALLLIEGERKLLRAGQSYDEIVLVSANADRAIISFDGQQQEYRLGSSGNFQFKKTQPTSFTVAANAQGLYFTSGSINGRSVDFLVDTGANMVSLNAHHARRLGIDFKKQGKPVPVITASQKVIGYLVKLSKIKIGEILLRDINAIVIDGEQPQTILLGMSFLENTRMTKRGGVMTIEKI